MFDDCFDSVVPVAVISQEISHLRILRFFPCLCMDFLKHIFGLKKKNYSEFNIKSVQALTFRPVRLLI